MSELRTSPRQRVMKSAKIVFGNGLSGVDCAVRNISATGACLEVVSPLGVPDNFVLIVGDESLKRSCRLAWRTAKRIGVAFQ
jgi:hypothetical protein